MIRAIVRLLYLLCAVAVSAIPQSGNAGLSFAQAAGNGFFDSTNQTANLSTGDGPLAIAVTSELPEPTTLAISANSPQDWLQIAIASDAQSCPADVTANPGYSNSVSLSNFSGTTTLCVLANDLLGLPDNSVYDGLLSFQTQAGTTFIPVVYSVFPNTYLHVSILDAGGGTHEVGGQTLAYAGKKSSNFQITAQNNGVTDPPPNLAVDIVLSPQANWLTLSTNSLPNLPGSLQMSVDTSRVSPGASTTVRLEGTNGGGELDFAIMVVPSAFPAVWRPSDGTWWLVRPNHPAGFALQWGLSGDVPVAADYDGDGKSDFAVWRPSLAVWYIVPSGNPGAPIVQQLGLPGDIPVPADYDGDGKTDLAVWRPSDGTWYILPSKTGALYTVQWGLPGDMPVPADYDGDGKADLAVWRPSEGNWYIVPSGTGVSFRRQWGAPDDMPVPADYDGDGKADLAVWRPSEGNWYIVPSGTGVPVVQQWGFPDDVPVPADYDGDGKADLAVWRPSDGNWYIVPSNGGVQYTVQWGLPGDIPLTNAPQ